MISLRRATAAAIAEAQARGFARLGTFLGASKRYTKAIREPLLRRRAVSYFRNHPERST